MFQMGWVGPNHGDGMKALRIEFAIWRLSLRRAWPQIRQLWLTERKHEAERNRWLATEHD
jgi:hypothetical protein